jgi:xanthine dehydrogenase accessory factor
MALIVRTHGHSYRKRGALMLVNEVGERLGMLTGGCLEAELSHQCRKVLSTGRATSITYNTETDEVVARLGTGCDGEIEVALVELTPSNFFLHLDACHLELDRGSVVRWTAPIAVATAGLEVVIEPAPRLLIVGGGPDMIALCALASTMSWQVEICDPRPAFARREHFLEALALHRTRPLSLHQRAPWDALLLASHNLSLDCEGLQLARTLSLRYLALVGPAQRKSEVLRMSGLREDDFSVPLIGPAGLALGGRNPESVALSIVAQCHAVLSTTHSMRPTHRVPSCPESGNADFLGALRERCTFSCASESERRSW